MAFELKFKKEDVDRITQRLRKFGKLITDPTGLIFQYKLFLLNNYKEVVAGAMGSVNALHGGRANLGLKFMEPTSVYWKNLSPATLTLKAYRQGTVTSSLTIWEDTGETKNAVGVYGDFAGIDGGRDAEAYKKAINTEFGGSLGDLSGWGGEWPSRPLFTIVNEEFKKNRHEMLLQIASRITHAKQVAQWGN